MHKKPFLPEKICPACNRPFSWRKKWERQWEAVRFCSQKCRNAKKSTDQQAQITTAPHTSRSE